MQGLDYQTKGNPFQYMYRYISHKDNSLKKSVFRIRTEWMAHHRSELKLHEIEINLNKECMDFFFFNIVSFFVYKGKHAINKG